MRRAWTDAYLVGQRVLYQNEAGWDVAKVVEIIPPRCRSRLATPAKVRTVGARLVVELEAGGLRVVARASALKDPR